MNRKTQVIFIIAIITVVFLTSGMNIIKNIINDSPATSYKVVVPQTPMGTNATSLDLKIDQTKLVLSYLSENKTEFIQNELQNQALTQASESSKDESSLTVTIEKYDGIGVIKDRILNIPDLNSFSNPNPNLPDLTGGKIRLSLEFQSKNPDVPIKLNGVIKITSNDMVLTKPFKIDGNSGSLKTLDIPIDGLGYHDIQLNPDTLKLNVGINKFGIAFQNIDGTMGSKVVSRTNFMIYEAEIKYSPELRIFIDEKDVTSALYPSGDSSITFSTNTSKYILYQPSAEQCLNKNTGSSYQPCYYYPTEQTTPAPIVKGIIVKNTATGEKLLNLSTLSGTSTVSLQRNTEYQIDIQEPTLSWKIKTPTDSAIRYSYNCVTTAPSGETTNNFSTGHARITTTCGHS